MGYSSRPAAAFEGRRYAPGNVTTSRGASFRAGTREVLRAIAAGVEFEVADADAMGRRIAERLSRESGPHPPAGTGTRR